MKLLGDWNWYLPQWLEWLPERRPAPIAEQQPQVGPSVGRAPIPATTGAAQ
jgi:hypothetical protein